MKSLLKSNISNNDIVTVEISKEECESLDPENTSLFKFLMKGQETSSHKYFVDQNGGTYEFALFKNDGDDFIGNLQNKVSIMKTFLSN